MASVPGCVIVRAAAVVVFRVVLVVRAVGVAFRVVIVVRAVVVVVRVVVVVVVVVSQILEWVPVCKKGLGPRRPQKEPPLLCPEVLWLRTDLFLLGSQC